MTARAQGSISTQGTKIPQAAWCTPSKKIFINVIKHINQLKEKKITTLINAKNNKSQSFKKKKRNEKRMGEWKRGKKYKPKT